MEELIGAKVIAVDDDHVYFDNGYYLESQDLYYYLCCVPKEGE